MPTPDIPSRLRAGYQYAAKQPQFCRYSTATLQYAEKAYSKIASLQQDLYYLGMSYYVRDLLIERMEAA
ncbi:hypothetical protein [Sporomusa sp.]|uniref:hypothetical protein n=1 Tax=Sporomusa sp. TaxID=2078658 RepID=UPI002C19DE59|nr:hypothetical protein [Sporomusa sp.]HWR07781.1 hypothetical protein [Sporomusa sp.]